MSVRGLQSEFVVAIGKLIVKAEELGYELTFGDAYRAPSAFGKFGEKKGYSAARSMHKMRLAVDFNLFVDGKYITSGSHPAYIKLGEYWESLHKDARWGGRFNDANHFSFTLWGAK